MNSTKLTQVGRDRFLQLYSLYLKGHSYRALGRQFCISGERVRQILNTYANTEERKLLREEIDRRHDTSWQTKEICALLEAGNSCRAVAEILNLSIYRIRRLNARRKKQVLESTESI